MGIEKRGKDRVPFSKSEKEEIKRRYGKNESSSSIGESLDRHPQNIRHVLRRMGVAIRPLEVACRRSTLDQSHFHKIDTEAKAYWLGFVSADGCVSDKNQLVLSLSARDTDHLGKLAEELQSDLIPRLSRDLTYCTIAFSSKILIADLAKYGVVPRKTFSIRLPDMPHHLMRHYIRGYTDGDGGIYKQARHGKYRDDAFTYRFQITTNYEMIKDIIAAIETHLGFGLKFQKARSVYTLYASSLNIVASVADWLYSDATVYLDRKYSVAKEIIQDSLA